MAIFKLFFGKGTKAIANYLGIIDSLEIKVKKMIESELNSGILALKQAQNSESEQKSLLREARSKLNKAIYLEKEERLVAAYLGLALCHFWLKDFKNCSETLKEFSETEIKLDPKKQVAATIRGEIGCLLIEATVSTEPIFNSKISKNLPSGWLKLSQRADKYIKGLKAKGEKLSEKNLYRNRQFNNFIEDIQLEASILIEQIPLIATNRIDPSRLEKLIITQVK